MGHKISASVNSPKYFTRMKEFAMLKSTSRDWIALDFSHEKELSGKLFRSSSLPTVINFLLMFHDLKSADTLFEDILRTKACNYDEKQEDCEENLEKVCISFEQPLFHNY